MENSLLKDRYGNWSSKRVFGAIGMIYSFILTAIDGFSWYSVNETIVITIIGVCATLLGLDSITDVWKKEPEAVVAEVEVEEVEDEIV